MTATWLCFNQFSRCQESQVSSASRKSLKSQVRLSLKCLQSQLRACNVFHWLLMFSFTGKCSQGAEAADQQTSDANASCSWCGTCFGNRRGNVPGDSWATFEMVAAVRARRQAVPGINSYMCIGSRFDIGKVRWSVCDRSHLWFVGD